MYFIFNHKQIPFLGLKAPQRRKRFPTATFLKAGKRDILRESMFLCSIFSPLQGLKGSLITRSDLEPDFSAKQNVD